MNLVTNHSIRTDLRAGSQGRTSLEAPQGVLLGLVDVEDCTEAGYFEDLVHRFIEATDAQVAPAGFEALGRRQQDAQAGTAYEIQLAKIHQDA